MTVTGTQARFELTGSANFDAVHVTGSAIIGSPLTTLAYATPPDIIYSLGMKISAGNPLVIDMETGIVTGSVAGVSQVETATVISAAGITGDGNATVSITGSELDPYTVVLSVPVTTAESTASLVAAEIRSFMATDESAAQILEFFTVGGTGADIVITKILAKSNDSALNIAIANGTCTGITSAPTSTDTTAGVSASFAYRIAGSPWEAVDAGGVPLATATKIYAFLAICSAAPGTTVDINASSGYSVNEKTPFVKMGVNSYGDHSWAGSTVTFSSDDEVLITLDIHAGT